MLVGVERLGVVIAGNRCRKDAANGTLVVSLFQFTPPLPLPLPLP